MSKRTSKSQKKKSVKKGAPPLSHPKSYVSKPLYLDINKLENEFSRADIEFVGVDHSGPSYEGRVFLNNDGADQDTPTTFDSGYVGSYYVFGHGSCFGDMGHCESPREWRLHDYRPSNPLQPAYIPLPITEDLRKVGRNNDKFTITIVPVLAKKTRKYEVDLENVVKFREISIITYD